MKYLNGFFKPSMALPCLIVLLLTTTFAVAGENSKTSLKAKVGNQQRQFFVKNEGQVTYTNGTPAEGVKYTLSNGNVKVYFQENRVSYTYPKREYKPTPERPDKDSILRTIALYRMDMVLQGANEEVNLKAKGEKASHSNYLTNPENPVEKVPHFGKLVYEEVYEGIDLVFKFDEGRLKYEFVVHENGEPSAIAMAYEGAESVEKAESGGLAVANPFGKLEEAEPIAFQQEDRNAEIPCEFVLQDDRKISFELEGEPEKPFVIDPYLSYSTFLGGSSADQANDITINNKGGNQIYVAGYTESSSFPNATGQISYQGNKDGFLAEFSADGSTLNWLTYYGNSGNERITGTDVYHASGSFRFPYVTGYSYSQNLPGNSGSGASGGTNPSYSSSNPKPSIFVAYFDKSGSIQSYVFIGSPQTDQSANIVYNNNGIFITGSTFATGGGFPTPNNAFGAQGGITDVVFAKFSNLNTLDFSTYYGGDDGDEFLQDIAIMPNGDLVMQGFTTSNNLVNVNGYQTIYGDNGDIFLARFTSSGSFVSSTYLGGVKDENIGSYDGLAVDNNGNIHVTGESQSTNFPTTSGAYQASNAGNKDIIYSRFDGLSTLTYSTYYGGSGDDEGKAIISYGNQNYVIAGQTYSTDIPVNGNEPPVQNNLHGTSDGLLAEFQQDDFHWGTYYGGSNSNGNNDEVVTGLAPSPDRNEFYACGYTNSQDYPVTGGAHQSNYGGDGSDAFLTGFDFDVTCNLPNMATYNDKTFTSSATLNGNYKINGYLEITSGTLTIKNANLLFDQCAELRVKNGANLTVKDASLNTCNPYWKGIRVESSGSDVDIDNAYIQNAEVGIDAKDPNTFSVLNSQFLENVYSISLRGYNNSSNSAKINDNYFENIDQPGEEVTFCSANPLPQQYYRPEVRKVINIEPLEEDIPVNNVDMERNEIRTTRKNYTLLQMFDVKYFDLNDFELLNEWKTDSTGQAIFLEYCENIQLYNIDMQARNKSGIEVYNGQTIDIRYSDLDIPDANPPSQAEDTGILLNNVSGNNRIEDNQIRDYGTGIAYYNNGNSNTSKINKNYFESNRFGLVVAPEEHPVGAPSSANSSTTTIRLDITCNKFWDNDVGILGCGNLKDQGNSTTGAGNNFDDQTGNSQNTKWDILWQYPVPGGGGRGFDYFHLTQGGTPSGYPPNNSGLSYGTYTMNGSTHPCTTPPCGQIDNDYRNQNANNQGCYGTWKRNPSTAMTDQTQQEDQEIKVFPNPFAETIQIRLDEAETGRIRATNLQGRELLNTPLQGKQQSLHTADWKPGMYFIQVIPDNGKTRTRKLLKTQ